MYQQLKGLILRGQVSAEADKLITIYTYEWGKISAIVPGAKKIVAKLSAATEPVVETDLMLYVSSPRARPKVTGAVLLGHFPGLRQQWRRFVAAQTCAEITDVLTPYNAENPQKYELLARTWQYLESAQYPWRIVMAFTLRFLKLSGYSFVDYLQREHSLIPPGQQQLIKKMATLPGDEVDRCLTIEEDVEQELKRHVDNYLSLHLTRPLGTRKFWQQHSNMCSAFANENEQKVIK